MALEKSVTNILKFARLKLYGTSTSTKLSDADGIYYANIALDDLIILILRSQGDWEINGTEATKNIVTGANQIDLGTTLIKLNRVEIKYPSSANSYTLAKQIDHKSIDVAMEEYTASPPEYDLFDGDKMYIFVSAKKANIAAVSAGVRIFFQIDYTELTAVGDTIDIVFPGVIKMMGLIVAYNYAIDKEMNNKVKIISNEIEKENAKLAEFFANKSTAKRISLRPRREDFNQGMLSGGGGVPTIQIG